MNDKVRPAVLLILDGWGMSDSTDHNAILAANTPQPGATEKAL